MNRRQQNAALRELDGLMLLLAELPKLRRDIETVILRNRFTSGQRKRKRGELGEMEGNGPPSHGDPTGETAVWEEVADETTTVINDLVDAITAITETTKALLDLVNVDTSKKVTRIVPDCLACGDACVGRVISGFDEKCYKAWLRQGRPDRQAFIFSTQAKLSTP
jgi:hypothetical protein